MEHATLDIHGVPVECWYVVEGRYIPATAYEPAECPYVELRAAVIGGVDVTAWDGQIIDVTGRLQQLLEARG